MDEKTTNSIHLVLNLSENSVTLVTKGNGREGTFFLVYVFAQGLPALVASGAAEGG